MALKRSLAVLLCGLGLAGCGQGNGGLTTGSILPAMPSLPSLPSVGSLVPGAGASSTPARPERVSGNLYRIQTGDRKLADPVQRENYALLSAAEGAREVGATHFVVVNASEATSTFAVAPAGTPSTSTLIRVMRIAPDAQPPSGAISVEEIVHFFGPTFGRGPDAQPAGSGGQG